jgi:UDP-N-acetylglucosamine--N-acetylmuramyl-(pentapeptide) pyrophosphoryl-undecaprenol N-acetylglucosamine transferase
VTRDSKVHVLLAGGGTGGHVFPALAVGEELVRRGAVVSFAGSPTGFEARAVPERGIAFYPLRSRPLVGRNLAGKVAALLTVLWAALAAASLVRRLGVDAVLGTGGYASMPGVLGAVLARRPVLLLEPNAKPGFANRRIARWAAGAAVAFEGTCRHLAPSAGWPCRATGVPVRSEFFAVPELAPAAGRAPRLLVLGGSQGALSVNRAVPRALARLAAEVPGLAVTHQTGRAHLEATREAYRAAGVPERVAELVPFIADVAGAMAAADVIVSRAGALTVSEIAAAGRAAVLVPLAIAEGHQRDNARALEAAGAARVVDDPPGDPDALGASLHATIADLLATPERLAAMGRAARAQSRAGAGAAIADWLLDLAGGGTGADPGGKHRSAATSAGSAGLGGQP